MKVNYNGLWKKLIDNKMKKKDLTKNIGISSNIIARMGKEEPVSLETVAKLCNYFSCSIDELISLKGGENNNGKIE
jgi:predicted transcriptional regulator